MVHFNQMIDLGERAMDEIHAGYGEQEDTTRNTHRDERRRSLILATYQLIAEKGFEHLRTRDVASRAGVNIATLHYYFASKEDLIPAVVEYLLHEFRTSPVPIPGMDDTTPLGMVRTMFLTTYNRFQAKPEMFIVLSELILRSLHDATLQPSLKLLDDEWHRYLQFLVTNGIRQGTFSSDLDPGDMA